MSSTTLWLLSLGLGAGVALAMSPLVWPRREPDLERPSRRLAVRLRRLLDGAGFAHTSVSHVILASLTSGIVCACVVAVVSPVKTLAVCAGLVGAWVPLSVLRARFRRRLRVNADRWPDVADKLVRSLRSGRGVIDALSELGESIPGAIGVAAASFGKASVTSAHVENNLAQLKASWADPSGDRIIEAIRLSRDIGGPHLIAILRALSQTLRDELAVRHEIVARASWIRVAAGVGAVAPWVVISLLSTRPEAVAAYQSSVGMVLIFAGLTLTVVAYRVMTRIGALRQERRWFT